MGVGSSGSDKKVLELRVEMVVQFHGCKKAIKFLTLHGCIRKYMSYIGKTILKKESKSESQISTYYIPKI